MIFETEVLRMKYDKNSEYGFPTEERGMTAPEFHPAGEEFSRTGELSAPADEFAPPETATKAPPEQKKTLHDRLKKLFLMPVAAAVASASVVLASFNVDPLGDLSSLDPTEIVDPEDGDTFYYYHCEYEPTGETFEEGPCFRDDTGMYA